MKSGEAYLRYWSIGVYCLGLGPEEIWDLTFAQYMALYDRYREQMSLQDFFTARIYSLLANWSRDQSIKPSAYSTEELMIFPPSQDGAAAVAAPHTWEEARGAALAIKQQWKDATEQIRMRKESRRGRISRPKSS